MSIPPAVSSFLSILLLPYRLFLSILLLPYCLFDNFSAAVLPFCRFVYCLIVFLSIHLLPDRLFNNLSSFCHLSNIFDDLSSTIYEKTYLFSFFSEKLSEIDVNISIFDDNPGNSFFQKFADRRMVPTVTVFSARILPRGGRFPPFFRNCRTISEKSSKYVIVRRLKNTGVSFGICLLMRFFESADNRLKIRQFPKVLSLRGEKFVIFSRN